MKAAKVAQAGNALALPTGWPLKLVDIGDSTQLPEGFDLLFTTDAEFNTYKEGLRSEYDTWKISMQNPAFVDRLLDDIDAIERRKTTERFTQHELLLRICEGVSLLHMVAMAQSMTTAQSNRFQQLIQSFDRFREVARDARRMRNDVKAGTQVDPQTMVD
jgi:hypothetical protein